MGQVIHVQHVEYVNQVNILKVNVRLQAILNALLVQLTQMLPLMLHIHVLQIVIAEFQLA